LKVKQSVDSFNVQNIFQIILLKFWLKVKASPEEYCYDNRFLSFTRNFCGPLCTLFNHLLMLILV